ncbi:MAG TPA: hypothetical protein DC053_23400 [Lachnoclostridium sp.]|nr:hypothetical protein [Lachnoclostridium sp.]
MPRKKELTKDEKIDKEIKRLKEIYKEVDQRKTKTLEGLIQECGFMRITLEELRKNINETGVVDEMPQGDYTILRESPYVKTYHTMIQRYTTANEKLLGLLPKEKEVPHKDDSFDNFVEGREDV